MVSSLHFVLSFRKNQSIKNVCFFWALFSMSVRVSSSTPHGHLCPPLPRALIWQVRGQGPRLRKGCGVYVYSAHTRGGGGSCRPGRPNFESLAAERRGESASPPGPGETWFAPARSPPSSSQRRRASQALRLSAAVLINKPLPPHSPPPGSRSPRFRVADSSPLASLWRPNPAPQGRTPIQLGTGRGAGGRRAGGWEPVPETQGGQWGERRREKGRGLGAERASLRACEPASLGASWAVGGAWAVPGLPAPAALQLSRASLKLCR